jgi:hypothetical protein
MDGPAVPAGQPPLTLEEVESPWRIEDPERKCAAMAAHVALELEDPNVRAARRAEHEALVRDTRAEEDAASERLRRERPDLSENQVTGLAGLEVIGRQRRRRRQARGRLVIALAPHLVRRPRDSAPPTPRASHARQAGHRRRQHIARATSSADPPDDADPDEDPAGDQPAGGGRA